MVYRDFPDVFHPDFEREAAAFDGAVARTERRIRPILGYFLMNEPAWGFSSETPAEGMLYNTESCASRAELARHLKARYIDDNANRLRAWKAAGHIRPDCRGKWTAYLSSRKP